MVSLFRTHDVRDCNLSTLHYDINIIPASSHSHPKKPQSDFKDAIADFRRKERFQRALTAGGADDLNELQREIDTDPRRFMVSRSDSRSLINGLIEGQTPLYIAAKNGHRDVVRFLLRHGADFLALSLCDDAQETCLEVAVRWHYFPVIKELLKKSWPSAVLKRSSKLTTNKEIKKMLDRPKACCF